MSRELMQQALEALEEEANPWTSSLRQSLRDRLAEPDDKPVAFAGPMPGSSGFTMVVFEATRVPLNTPLYTRPAARKEKQ